MSEREQHHRMHVARLEEWRAVVVRLKEQAETARGDERDRLHSSINECERSIREGEARLEELRATDDGAWAAAKDDWNAEWDMVESGFKKHSEAFRYE